MGFIYGITSEYSRKCAEMKYVVLLETHSFACLSPSAYLTDRPFFGGVTADLSSVDP